MLTSVTTTSNSNKNDMIKLSKTHSDILDASNS